MTIAPKGAVTLSESFDVSAAEALLRERFGEPIPTIKPDGNKYIVSFELPDGKQIALEKTGASVRLWVEDIVGAGPPPVSRGTPYEPTQGRQSNLPTRLRHAPRTGVEPRPVIQFKLQNRDELVSLLDWYDAPSTGHPMLTKEAVLNAIAECRELGVDAFLAKHGFVQPRTYWISHSDALFPCKAVANVAWRAVEGPNATIRDATVSRAAVVRLGFKVVGQAKMPLDENALLQLKTRFLAIFPDFPGLTFEGKSGGYFEQERRYKDALLDQAEVAMKASANLDAEELGGRLLDLLIGPESGFLGWRTDARIRNLRASNPGVLEQAAAALVSSKNELPQAAEAFVQATWAALSEGQEKNRPYSESRNIPSMLLALVRPEDALGINTEPLGRFYKSLTGKPLFGWNPMSADEYAEVLRFAGAIFDKFSEWGWNPRDLWDVQSFAWVLKDSSATPQAAIAQPEEAKNMMTKPTNLILYGPPGTGKTYRTAREAVRLCGEDVPNDRDALMTLYSQLQDSGRIEFATFHQSMSYEDFIEGRQPTTGGDDEEGSQGFRLETVPGIFRRIARRAETSRGKSANASSISVGQRQLFKTSIGDATDPADDYLFEEAIAGGYTLLGFDDIDWSDAKFSTREAIISACQAADGDNTPLTGMNARVQMPFIFRNWVNPGDIIIVSKGTGLFRAIGEVTGGYEYHPRPEGGYAHRRKVRWLWVDRAGVPVSEIYPRKFSMRTIYLLYDNLVNVQALERYMNSQQVGSEADVTAESFVLIIDEINRANISKVFGELITLLEPDKRVGQPNELRVRLPYSGDRFGVPANLHILGTMNTADRSIALLDTALRRRFTFEELMPEPELLSDVASRTGIDLVAVLRSLNERIEYLFDREHQIGHAYFIHCQTVADVHETMRYRIIPLLAEYFYEDWSKVALVLGDADGAGRFIVRTTLKAPAGMQSDGFSEDRYRWQVRDQFDDDAYAAAFG
jgi:hypothetical protein